MSVKLLLCSNIFLVSTLPLTDKLLMLYLITENIEYLGIKILYLRNFNIYNNSLLYWSELCELNATI